MSDETNQSQMTNPASQEHPGPKKYKLPHTLFDLADEVKNGDEVVLKNNGVEVGRARVLKKDPPRELPHPEKPLTVENYVMEVLFDGPIPIDELVREANAMENTRHLYDEPSAEAWYMVKDINNYGLPAWWKGDPDEFQYQFQSKFNYYQDKRIKFVDGPGPYFHTERYEPDDPETMVNGLPDSNVKICDPNVYGAARQVLGLEILIDMYNDYWELLHWDDEDIIPENILEQVLLNGPIPLHLLDIDMEFNDEFAPFIQANLPTAWQMCQEIMADGKPSWWTGSREEFQEQFQERCIREFRRGHFRKHLGMLWFYLGLEEVHLGRASMPERFDDSGRRVMINLGWTKFRQMRALKVLITMTAEALNQ